MVFTGRFRLTARVIRPASKEDAVMKLLFAIRNKVMAAKSLKASAWYLWY